MVKDLPSDVFEDAYISALLAIENDNNDQPLDKNYAAGDFGPGIEARLRSEARAFYMACADLLKDENLTYENRFYAAVDMGGHDFALTRNGHGSGFWDGGWKEPAAKIMTYAAKACGERHLYVGDDGLIYSQ